MASVRCELFVSGCENSVCLEAWRIIPVGKWLMTMVIVSSLSRVVGPLPKYPKWLMDGGYYWDDPPSTPWYILSERYIGIYNLWIGRPCHESYPRTLNSFQVSWGILHISYSICLRFATFFRSWIVKIRFTFRWYIPKQSTGYQKTTHTHTHQDDIQRQICREPMWTTTLALWEIFAEINVPASTHPTLGPIRIRKRSAISGFGFSDLIGLWISQPLHAHLGVLGRRGGREGWEFRWSFCITERVS